MEKAPPYAEPVPFNLEFAVLFLTGLLPSRAPLCFGLRCKVTQLSANIIRNVSNTCLQFDLLRHTTLKNACKLTHTPNNNAFCLIPENLAVVALVNYKTEDITFSVLDLTFNKILWNCNINETNVGLEYLRITMQGAGSDCIDVSTNQYDYCISLSEEICKKKN